MRAASSRDGFGRPPLLSGHSASQTLIWSPTFSISRTWVTRSAFPASRVLDPGGVAPSEFGAAEPPRIPATARTRRRGPPAPASRACRRDVNAAQTRLTDPRMQHDRPTSRRRVTRFSRSRRIVTGWRRPEAFVSACARSLERAHADTKPMDQAPSERSTTSLPTVRRSPRAASASAAPSRPTTRRPPAAPRRGGAARTAAR